MKRIIIFLVLMVISFSLCACGKVDNLIKDIDTSFQQETISQDTIDGLFERYNALSSEEKEKITNYDKLKKYYNVDVEKCYAIKNAITDITRESPFKDVLSVYNDYEAMNENEKALVDITKITDAMRMTNIEKATVAACQYIKQSLKSSSSFELYEASVIDDLNGSTKYYLVNIKYSATNGFGGRKDDTSFQTINKDYKNPWYALSFLNGDYSSALKCTAFQSFYLTSNTTPTKIDCDKVLYYIDTNIN